MTLSAVLTNKRVAHGVSQQGTPLMHGPTFMANPLACSVALASINLLLNSNWQQKVLEIESTLKQGLLPLKDLPEVTDCRVLGAIGVVEMKSMVDVATVQKLFIEHGVWIRPFGKLIYTMPPYIIESSQLETLTTSFQQVIKQL